MKILFVLGLLVFASLFFTCTNSGLENEQSINPLLGDISFLDKFGYTPTRSTDEHLRIRTHLEYVEMLLRQKDVSQLDQAQQKKRKFLLDLLHDYWTTGVFPRIYDHAETRVPCFIDKNGAICAVGYLIAQTAGREIAEQINTAHKYDKLLAMNDPLIDDWITSSGLSKMECAMIQPTYGTPSNSYENFNSGAYLISSALLGCVNVSLLAGNTFQIGKGGKKDKTLPVLSLFTSVGSIVYGSINYAQSVNPKLYPQINGPQRSISMVNIGLGASTMILAICNLSLKKRKKPLSWNINSYTTPANKLGLCVSLTRRI